MTKDKAVHNDEQASAASASSSDESAFGSHPTSSDDEKSGTTDTSSSDDGHGPPGPPSVPSGSSPSHKSSEPDSTARKRGPVPNKRKEQIEKADRIKVIRPANGRFKTLLDFRTYFLIRSQVTYSPKNIVFRLSGNLKMAFSGALKSILGRKRYAIRTHGDAINWLLSKSATHATMANAYQDVITMKQQDSEAPTAFGHRVETQFDNMTWLFKIQDVKDVFITGLSDLVQAHVRVLSGQFPDRTLSETVSTDHMYWDGTNKLHLQLKNASQRQSKSLTRHRTNEKLWSDHSHRSARRDLLGP